MEKIRKVFIDCGIWTGDSIKAFKEYDSKESYPYEIFGFECEPRLKKELTDLSRKINFEFINKAVWVNNNKIKLFPGVNNLTQSSSLLSEKKKYINKKKYVEVKAIDFSEWILDNFDKSDYIICKMNIEGAEYPILEKMIKDGSIDYIDKLYISWHWRKLEGFSKDRHEKIKNEIQNRTEVIKWKFVEGVTENPFK